MQIREGCHKSARGGTVAQAQPGVASGGGVQGVVEATSGVRTSGADAQAKRLGRSARRGTQRPARPGRALRQLATLRPHMGGVLAPSPERETADATEPNLAALRDRVDAAFAEWLGRRYAGLASLPPPPPVMLHHVPHVLAHHLDRAGPECRPRRLPEESGHGFVRPDLSSASAGCPAGRGRAPRHAPGSPPTTGNVEATGCGRPAARGVVGLRDKCVHVCPNATLRLRAAAEFADTRPWPPSGLPQDYLPLLAPERSAFVRKGKRVVAHGGAAWRRSSCRWSASP